MIPSTAISRAAAAVLATALGAALQPGASAAAAQAERLYAENCASCHGGDRLGGTGPALIPEALSRIKLPALERIIAEGRPATQMPAFSERVAAEDIAALARLINSPLAVTPRWTADEIAASRRLSDRYRPAARPSYKADPLNLFIVVETGDHHVSVLDGDTFERLDRFATPFAVHGGPKFTPDGRFVFIMSRDGWVQKYDLWALEEAGRIRAGINSRNIAISKDGRWLAVANYLPRTLTILSTADLGVARVIEVADEKGVPSRVSAVYQAPSRDSFVLALKDVAEIWEISTDAGAARSEEPGPRTRSLFDRRRIAVSTPIDDFFFDPDYRNLIGAARDGQRGVVVDLDAGRETAELPLPGMPHLGSGISWMRSGRRVMATPHLKEARLSVISVGDWSLVATIRTDGPGFFLRSHENSPYVWADAFLGARRDVMHVIDKDTLEIARTLQPAPGKTVAHVEFDRYGRHALVSVWEDEGALVIYDAKSLVEVKRLPMRRPSGKYNVFNKITFSEGTSH